MQDYLGSARTCNDNPTGCSNESCSEQYHACKRTAPMCYVLVVDNPTMSIVLATNCVASCASTDFRMCRGGVIDQLDSPMPMRDRIMTHLTKQLLRFHKTHRSSPLVTSTVRHCQEQVPQCSSTLMTAAQWSGICCESKLIPNSQVVQPKFVEAPR